MKKLMTVTLALSFLTGVVGTMFAQDTSGQKTETPKKTKRSKKSKKTAEAPKF